MKKLDLVEKILGFTCIIGLIIIFLLDCPIIIKISVLVLFILGYIVIPDRTN